MDFIFTQGNKVQRRLLVCSLVAHNSYYFNEPLNISHLQHLFSSDPSPQSSTKLQTLSLGMQKWLLHLKCVTGHTYASATNKNKFQNINRQNLINH